MTPREFSDAARKTRVREAGVSAARMVLLEGYGYTEAGNRMEPPLSRQAVFQAVRSISRSYSRIKKVGVGYRVVTVVLPSEKAADVLNMERLTTKTHPDQGVGFFSKLLSLFSKQNPPAR